MGKIRNIHSSHSHHNQKRNVPTKKHKNYRGKKVQKLTNTCDRIPTTLKWTVTTIVLLSMCISANAIETGLKMPTELPKSKCDYPEDSSRRCQEEVAYYPDNYNRPLENVCFTVHYDGKKFTESEILKTIDDRVTVRVEGIQRNFPRRIVSGLPKDKSKRENLLNRIQERFKQKLDTAPYETIDTMKVFFNRTFASLSNSHKKTFTPEKIQSILNELLEKDPYSYEHRNILIKLFAETLADFQDDPAIEGVLCMHGSKHAALRDILDFDMVKSASRIWCPTTVVPLSKCNNANAIETGLKMPTELPKSKCDYPEDSSRRCQEEVAYYPDNYNRPLENVCFTVHYDGKKFTESEILKTIDDRVTVRVEGIQRNFPRRIVSGLPKDKSKRENLLNRIQERFKQKLDTAPYETIDTMKVFFNRTFASLSNSHKKTFTPEKIQSILNELLEKDPYSYEHRNILIKLFAETLADFQDDPAVEGVLCMHGSKHAALRGPKEPDMEESASSIWCPTKESLVILKSKNF